MANAFQTIHIPDERVYRPLNGFSHEKYSKDDFDALILSAQEIDDRIPYLAAALEDRFRGTSPHFLWLAEGAERFFEDVTREYILPYTSSSIKVSSYGDEGLVSSGERALVSGDLSLVRGKDVVVLDDILDSGGTIKDVVSWCNDHGANSVISAVMLDKRDVKKQASAEYALFSIPDAFIVGRGLNYGKHFRDLDSIYTLSESAQEKYREAA